PAAVLFLSLGHSSMQSSMPSPSVSTSGMPGHLSMQSATPSKSLSVSSIPQPHMPGASLKGSAGHRSQVPNEVSTQPSGPVSVTPPSLAPPDPLDPPL